MLHTGSNPSLSLYITVSNYCDFRRYIPTQNKSNTSADFVLSKNYQQNTAVLEVKFVLNHNFAVVEGFLTSLFVPSRKYPNWCQKYSSQHVLVFPKTSRTFFTASRNWFFSENEFQIEKLDCFQSKNLLHYMCEIFFSQLFVTPFKIFPSALGWISLFANPNKPTKSENVCFFMSSILKVIFVQEHFQFSPLKNQTTFLVIEKVSQQCFFAFCFFCKFRWRTAKIFS